MINSSRIDKLSGFSFFKFGFGQNDKTPPSYDSQFSK